MAIIVGDIHGDIEKENFLAYRKNEEHGALGDYLDNFTERGMVMTISKKETLPVKIALFDLDDTLADYQGQVLYDLKRIASPDEPPILNVFSTKPYLSARRKIITSQLGWWLNLPKFKLGWDVLEVVKELGFSVAILTRGPKSNHTAWSEKVQWCKKHLGKLITGITVCHDKSIVYGAVLVDDYPAYIKGWLAHRPRGLVIMPAHYYNSDFVHPQVIRYDGTNIEEVRQRLSERFERHE